MTPECYSVLKDRHGISGSDIYLSSPGDFFSVRSSNLPPPRLAVQLSPSESNYSRRYFNGLLLINFRDDIYRMQTFSSRDDQVILWEYSFGKSFEEHFSQFVGDFVIIYGEERTARPPIVAVILRANTGAVLHRFDFAHDSVNELRLGFDGYLILLCDDGFDSIELRTGHRRQHSRSSEADYELTAGEIRIFQQCRESPMIRYRTCTYYIKDYLRHEQLTFSIQKEYCPRSILQTPEFRFLLRKEPYGQLSFVDIRPRQSRNMTQQREDISTVGRRRSSRSVRPPIFYDPSS